MSAYVAMGIVVHRGICVGMSMMDTGTIAPDIYIMITHATHVSTQVHHKVVMCMRSVIMARDMYTKLIIHATRMIPCYGERQLYYYS